MKFAYIVIAIWLNACVYADERGNFAVLDLPVGAHSTIDKTITVNAPPGTTVILQEIPPPVIYERKPRLCFYHTDTHRRECRYD